jgi:hypothetical protein
MCDDRYVTELELGEHVVQGSGEATVAVSKVGFVAVAVARKSKVVTRNPVEKYSNCLRHSEAACCNPVIESSYCPSGGTVWLYRRPTPSLVLGMAGIDG